jgi:nitrogen fixation NifU-like protein
MYSDRVLEHFRNPRNVGLLQDADGVGRIGDPACGDYLLLFLRIRGNRVVEARFLCRGCPAAIACASMTTELATGRHVDEAWDITDEAIIRALGGLPEAKLHCSNLGATALHMALFDYFDRRNRPRHPSEHAEEPETHEQEP